MRERGSKSQKVLLVALLAGIAAVFVGTVLVVRPVRASARVVFDDMLSQNLSSSRFIKTISYDQNGTELDQVISVNLLDKRCRWQATASHGDSTVSTESIGTPYAGFMRYLSVKAGSKNVQSYSDVINKWGKSSKGDDLSRLYEQSILDYRGAPIPPLAQLNAQAKQDLLGYIPEKDIFKIVSSRPATYDRQDSYIYNVSVNQADYLRMIEKLARAEGMNPQVGQPTIDSLAKAPSVRIQLTVGKASHRLLSASSAQGSYLATYSYDDLQPISLPKTSMTISELQKLASN